MHVVKCSERYNNRSCRNISSIILTSQCTEELTKSFQAELTTLGECIVLYNVLMIAYDPLPTMKASDPAGGK